MKHALLSISGCVVLGCTLVMIAQQYATRGPDPVTGAEPDPAVVSRLQEIVTIRERQVKNHQLLLESGRAPVESAPELDLIEARLRLAGELRQADGVIAELKNLVAAHERHVKRIEEFAREWRSSDVDKARVDLLDAEIRLMKERRQATGVR